MLYPRLELRWRKTRPGEYDGYEWACDYILVLARATVGDIRCNSNDKYAVKPVQYVLNTAYRNGSLAGPGDTPFRDGLHAMWDSVILKDLPIYSIVGRRSKRIYATDKARKTALSRLNNTDNLTRHNKRKIK